MSEQKNGVEPDADILAIRALLNDEGAEPPAVRARPVTAIPPKTPAASRDTAEDPGDAGLSDRIRAAERAADTAGARRPRLPAPVQDRIARLRAYRPTLRHVALAALVLLVVLRPWLLVTVVLLPALIVAGIFLSVGHDRFWAGVLRLYNRFHARNPEKAERLRRRADGIALRWDAFLDRFPEGTVDALYLPDLNSLQDQEERHRQALAERFDKLQDEARAQRAARP